MKSLEDIERLPMWTDTPAPKASPSWEKGASSHKGTVLGRVVAHVVILHVLSHSHFTVGSASSHPYHELTHTKR